MDQTKKRQHNKLKMISIFFISPIMWWGAICPGAFQWFIDQCEEIPSRFERATSLECSVWDEIKLLKIAARVCLWFAAILPLSRAARPEQVVIHNRFRCEITGNINDVIHDIIIYQSSGEKRIIFIVCKFVGSLWWWALDIRDDFGFGNPSRSDIIRFDLNFLCFYDVLSSRRSTLGDSSGVHQFAARIRNINKKLFHIIANPILLLNAKCALVHRLDRSKLTAVVIAYMHRTW
jgi:hypothetical protein